MLGKFYELVSGGHAHRAFFAFLAIGLAFGCLLFFAARTSYMVSQEDKTVTSPPSESTTIVGGDGSANIGKNSGTVTVDNNAPKKSK